MFEEIPNLWWSKGIRERSFKTISKGITGKIYGRDFKKVHEMLSREIHEKISGEIFRVILEETKDFVEDIHAEMMQEILKESMKNFWRTP